MAAKPIALIISDDMDFTQTMKRLLQRWGIIVEMATDVAYLPADGIDVVLFDTMRQESDWLSLLASVRSKMADSKLILVNRVDNIQLSIAGMQAGADDEIILPFDTAILKKKIISAIQSRKKTAEKKYSDQMNKNKTKTTC